MDNTDASGISSPEVWQSWRLWNTLGDSWRYGSRGYCLYCLFPNRKMESQEDLIYSIFEKTNNAVVS